MYDLNDHPRNGYYIIYGRVSTGSDEQHNSIVVQTKDDETFSYYEKFKNTYNYTCYEIYSDEASGTSTDGRTGFQEMLRFFGFDYRLYSSNDKIPTNGNVEEHTHYHFDVHSETIKYVRDTLKINYILCKNTARWTRDADFKLIDVLRNHGIYIYFKDEDIDTYIREKDVLLGFIQTLDRNKSQDTSKKVTSGMEASYKRGNVRTNSRIYGYNLIPKTLSEPAKLTIIPEEAEVIRLIFELYIEKGLGSRQIANELKRRGIVTRPKTTKKGKTLGGIPFSVSTIKTILSNEKYCGYVNTSKKWDSGHVFNHKSPTRLYGYEIKPSNNIEPIISIDAFKKAREICQARSNVSSPRGRNTGKSIYAGKIICGICGSTYCQNGDIDRNGIYIKKMNCGKKKRYGLTYCDNTNISFIEIERRYKELSENFNEFLSLETRKQYRLLLMFLFVIFDYFYIDRDSIVNEINETISNLNEQYEELIVQRATLPTNAQIIMNDKIDDVAKQILQERAKLLQIDKEVDRFRPLINRILIALDKCMHVDLKRTYTVEDLMKYDLRMITYPDTYKWEMHYEDYSDVLDKEPKIAEDLYLYLNDERFYISDDDLDKKLKIYYDKFGAHKKYFFNNKK